jgi:hypothetical protein
MRIPGKAITALLVFALGGCGAAPGPAGAGSAGKSRPAGSASPGPGASGTPAADDSPSTGANPNRPAPDVLVTYGRQGGLAGLDDKLSVRPDGGYEVTHRGGAVATGRLSPDEMAGLRTVLDGSRFTEIPAMNPATGVADGFTYRVGYQNREVVAQDGAVPAALQPVIGALDKILARAA